MGQPVRLLPLLPGLCCGPRQCVEVPLPLLRAKVAKVVTASTELLFQNSTNLTEEAVLDCMNIQHVNFWCCAQDCLPKKDMMLFHHLQLCLKMVNSRLTQCQRLNYQRCIRSWYIYICPTVILYNSNSYTI